MNEMAVILDFMGTIASFSDLERKVVAMPGSVKAIERLYEKDCEIFISSKASCASIDAWIEENNLGAQIYFSYGREDGSKEEHIQKIERYGDYEEIIFIADMPEDFVFKTKTKVRKIAVNTTLPHELFPIDVNIFEVPLTVKLVETIIRG
ncbi:MAG: hypothetical protein MCSN_2160 [Candidatus Microsyncoccus archaeolyticus]|jgi:phosphoglycolate phosphatase-like HAD superfamily hydrolase|nr:MAG: hypothetical protein MCSN_2160 [Candidatus Parcubacteria bacterium]